MRVPDYRQLYVRHFRHEPRYGERRKCGKFRGDEIAHNNAGRVVHDRPGLYSFFMEIVTLQRAERVAVDFPMPSRNFAATRRVLLIVLAVSIVFPLACLAGYGYFDYQRRIADSNDMIDRLARVTEEQAVKVLDLNQQMASRIVDLLGNDNDAQIRAQESGLHDRLRQIGGDFPQVASIYLLGADGKLLVSSRAFPAPVMSTSQREDFTAAKAMRPQPYFSLPLFGPLSQTNVFNTATGRWARTGNSGRGVRGVAHRLLFALLP